MRDLSKYDLIVIGGGVLGTFHAYWALKNGLKVLLLEKDNKPQAASVRNFGQVVPSGMNAKWQEYGIESLALYKELQQYTDLSIRQNGTVYIASNEEEETLITELHQINKQYQYPSQLLTGQQCLQKYDGLRSDYVKSALFFPQEVTVEPRSMLYKLQLLLQEKYGLEIRSNSLAIHAEEVNDGVEIVLADQSKIYADKLVVCSGSDVKSLFPEIYLESDLQIVKLQMMQTQSQQNYKLEGSILTGWTIRRYEAFTECPSFKEIKAREDMASYQNQWGIHILFKQALDGSVIIGDSHEYIKVSDQKEHSFDTHTELDNFMIAEAKKIMNLPNYNIQKRWHGYYAQCQYHDIFNKSIGDRIHLVTGIGGKGMTGRAGYAKESINNILNK